MKFKEATKKFLAFGSALAMVSTIGSSPAMATRSDKSLRALGGEIAILYCFLPDEHKTITDEDGNEHSVITVWSPQMYKNVFIDTEFPCQVVKGGSEGLADASTEASCAAQAWCQQHKDEILKTEDPIVWVDKEKKVHMIPASKVTELQNPWDFHTLAALQEAEARG
jgi:hypothetical protein